MSEQDHVLRKRNCIWRNGMRSLVKENAGELDLKERFLAMGILLTEGRTRIIELVETLGRLVNNIIVLKLGAIQ